MDPITQAAFGSVVAQTVAQRKLGFRIAIYGAAVGVMPDVDTLFGHGSDYFEQLVNHRGITHSIFFAPIVGPLIAYCIWYLRDRRPDNLKYWILAVTLSIWSHPWLDYLTPYGTQLLLPFSDARFSAFTMPVIDPLFTLLLVVGIVIAARSNHSQWIAGITIIFSFAYIGYSTWLNNSAEQLARNQLANKDIVAEVTAFPTLLQIHYRRIVARSSNIDRVGYVSMWNPCEIKWGESPRVSIPMVKALLQTREGRIFNWFTMGFTHYAMINGELHTSDLRYGEWFDPRRSVFSIQSKYDTNGNLVSTAKRTLHEDGVIANLYRRAYFSSCDSS